MANGDGRPMEADATDFSATRRAGGDDGPPGAIAAFPYDRMTVERFREAFPRARWRDDLRAWFVPGTQAERRLARWAGREWSGVLAFADARGRDAFAFEPWESAYLETEDDLMVRTPYARDVIKVLREVPWARWDPGAKAWRVPFRALAELRGHWPAVEEAARRAEPEARRARQLARKAQPGDDDSRAEAAERRRRRHPVPADALPPLGRVLMTQAGCVVFEAVTGELADPAVRQRFYAEIAGGRDLVWAGWRRPDHAELVQGWPARHPPDASELARGWWQPDIAVLRKARRQAASLARARETRRARPAA